MTLPGRDNSRELHPIPHTLRRPAERGCTLRTDRRQQQYPVTPSFLMLPVFPPPFLDHYFRRPFASLARALFASPARPSVSQLLYLSAPRPESSQARVRLLRREVLPPALPQALSRSWLFFILFYFFSSNWIISWRFFAKLRIACERVFGFELGGFPRRWNPSGGRSLEGEM